MKLHISFVTSHHWKQSSCSINKQFTQQSIQPTHWGLPATTTSTPQPARVHQHPPVWRQSTTTIIQSSPTQHQWISAIVHSITSTKMLRYTNNQHDNTVMLFFSSLLISIVITFAFYFLIFFFPFNHSFTATNVDIFYDTF